MRDMFQNHLLQLLTLTAMEPPATMAADAVRDEKVKVLRSLRWLRDSEVDRAAVRAQYAAGQVDGVTAVGYRDEQDVAKVSTTDLRRRKFFHRNWRWKLSRSSCAPASAWRAAFRDPRGSAASPPLICSVTRRANRSRPRADAAHSTKRGRGALLSGQSPRRGVPALTRRRVNTVAMDFMYSKAFGDHNRGV